MCIRSLQSDTHSNNKQSQEEPVSKSNDERHLRRRLRNRSTGTVFEFVYKVIIQVALLRCVAINVYFLSFRVSFSFFSERLKLFAFSAWLFLCYYCYYSYDDGHIYLFWLCRVVVVVIVFFSPFVLFVLIHRYTVVQRRIIDLEYLMSLLYESGNICWSLDSFIRSELNRSHNNLCSILHPLNQFDSDFSISLARLI